MLRFLLLAVILAAVVPATATTLIAGPVAADVSLTAPDHCALGVSGAACPVGWSPGGPGLGDDTFTVTPGVTSVELQIRGAGLLPSGALEVSPSDVVLHHGLWAPVEALGTAVGSAEPAPAASVVSVQPQTLQTQGGDSAQALLLQVHLPVAPAPGGRPIQTLTVPITPESGYYVTGDGWDSASTETSIRPLPNGVHAQDSTDHVGANTIASLRCDGEAETNLGGPACAALLLAQAEGGATLTSVQGATPNVVNGVEVGSVGLVVTSGPVPLAAAVHGRTGAREALPPGTHGLAGSAGATNLALGPPLGAHGKHSFVGASEAADAPSVQTATSAAFLAALPALNVAELLAAAGLGALGVFVLYHRIVKHRALEQDTRRRIHDAIARAPGIRVGTLQAELSLNYNTVLRHVRLLEHCGLIEGQGEGQKRWFLRDATLGVQAKQAAVAASSPVAQQVLRYLEERGPVDVPTLRADLHLPRSSASTAISRLVRAGVVAKSHEGRRLVVGLASRSAALAPPAEARVSPAPYVAPLPAPYAPLAQ